MKHTNPTETGAYLVTFKAWAHAAREQQAELYWTGRWHGLPFGSQIVKWEPVKIDPTKAHYPVKIKPREDDSFTDTIIPTIIAEEIIETITETPTDTTDIQDDSFSGGGNDDGFGGGGATGDW